MSFSARAENFVCKSQKTLAFLDMLSYHRDMEYSRENEETLNRESRSLERRKDALLSKKFSLVVPPAITMEIRAKDFKEVESINARLKELAAIRANMYRQARAALEGE